MRAAHDFIYLLYSLAMEGKKCYTFAGGPTMAPDFLKEDLFDKMFDQNNSLLNLNSDCKEFKEMEQKVKVNLKLLLNIPSHYHIWFCSGGVHLQFAGIPMNFAEKGKQTVANYTTTGWFSKLAFDEADKYLKAHSIADLQKDKNGRFVLPDEFHYAPNAVYTHFVDNETVEGLQYPENRLPFQAGVPLLDDCSSSIITKPINWEKISMAYAHTQKNLGISGNTLIIVNENMLKTFPRSDISQVCDFRLYQQKNGFPFVTNSASLYSMMAMTEQLIESGGIDFDRFKKRADQLYSVLEKHHVFRLKVKKQFRSRINVTWECETPELSQKCISEGIENGLYEFKGHRTVGGFRASLFNPVPDEAVSKLASFLDHFGEKYE